MDAAESQELWDAYFNADRRQRYFLAVKERLAWRIRWLSIAIALLSFGPTVNFFAGDWVGNVYGTNNGYVYARFEQDGAELTGEARFMDDRLGATTYAVTGRSGERVEFTLNPTLVPENVEASVVTGSLELAMDGKLHGRWASAEQGTGGVLTLQRFLMPSQLRGGAPEQAQLRHESTMQAVTLARCVLGAKIYAAW